MQGLPVFVVIWYCGVLLWTAFTGLNSYFLKRYSSGFVMYGFLRSDWGNTTPAYKRQKLLNVRDFFVCVNFIISIYFMFTLHFMYICIQNIIFSSYIYSLYVSTDLSASTNQCSPESWLAHSTIDSHKTPLASGMHLSESMGVPRCTILTHKATLTSTKGFYVAASWQRNTIPMYIPELHKGLLKSTAHTCLWVKGKGKFVCKTVTGTQALSCHRML